MKFEHRQALEAVIFTVKTIYNDLIGYNVQRNRLLRQFWVTQKSFTRLGREMTCLQVENRESAASVLLIHGSPGNAMDWIRFLHNPDIFSLWAVDRPGYGPTPQIKPKLEDNMDLLSDLLGSISSEKKFIIVGHSLGAGIAVRLAADYPGSVGGLILIGAALNPEAKGSTNIFVGIFRFICGLLFSRSIRHSGDELRQYQKFLQDMEPRFKEIKCPITLIHSEDDTFVPPENLDYGNEKFSGSSCLQITKVDKGGHFLHRKRPQILIKAMREMVKKL